MLSERKIGVIFFKQVQIIGWWDDTDSFMNWNISIMGIITDTQNPGSEYMHSRYRNVDSE